VVVLAWGFRLPYIFSVVALVLGFTVVTLAWGFFCGGLALGFRMP